MKRPRGRPVTINHKAMTPEQKKAYQKEVSHRRHLRNYKHKMRQIDYEDLRECRHCKVQLLRTEDNFYKNKNSRFGFATTCKKCMNAFTRRRSMRAIYGGTVEEYKAVMAGASCEICGSRERLCLDHCHDKGHVRGVLCANCNSALGLFADDEARLFGAIAYLAKTRNGYVGPRQAPPARPVGDLRTVPAPVKGVNPGDAAHRSASEPVYMPVVVVQ